MFLLDQLRDSVGCRARRQHILRPLYEVYFHYATADAAYQLAVGSDRHFVSSAAGARAAALGHDEQYDAFVSAKTFGDEIPELEFFGHGRILS